MADEPGLTLSGLAHRCSEETDRFFRREPYDPRYCYELLRRAILQRDPRAWELVYAQYKSLVTGWAARHPAYREGEEEIQYFVNRAFEKLWNSIPPEKFYRFPDLKALLRYLQMCTHSAVVDHSRLAQRAARLAAEEPLDSEAAAVSEIASNSDDLDAVQRLEWWQKLMAHLHDEREQLVVHGTYVLDLKPRELCRRYRSVFSSVREVYRVKQNVLARLRRDEEWAAQFLEQA